MTKERADRPHLSAASRWVYWLIRRYAVIRSLRYIIDTLTPKSQFSSELKLLLCVCLHCVHFGSCLHNSAVKNKYRLWVIAALKEIILPIRSFSHQLMMMYRKRLSCNISPVWWQDCIFSLSHLQTSNLQLYKSTDIQGGRVGRIPVDRRILWVLICYQEESCCSPAVPHPAKHASVKVHALKSAPASVYVNAFITKIGFFTVLSVSKARRALDLCSLDCLTPFWPSTPCLHPQLSPLKFNF